MKLRWVLLFFLIGVAWGSLWLTTSGSFHPVPLLCAGCLRFAAAAGMLWLASILSAMVRRKQRKEHPRRTWMALSAVLGSTLLAVPYLCSAWASGAVRPHLHAASPGFPAGVYAAMPMAVLLMSGEDAPALLPRLLLGLIGVVLLVAQGIAVDAASWAAELLVIVGMISNAFALVYARRSSRNQESALTLRSCAAQFTTAALALGLIAWLNGDWKHYGETHSSASVDAWVGLFAAALVSAVTLPAMYLLLDKLGDITTATLQWLVALTGVAEASWLLRANTLWVTRSGAVLTLGALVWTWLLRPTPGENHRLLSNQR